MSDVRFFGPIVFLASVACSQPDVASPTQQQAASAIATQQASPISHTAETIVRSRASVVGIARGAFRPGQPLTIVGEVTGRYVATQSVVTMAVSGDSTDITPRVIARTMSLLSTGAGMQLTRVVTFTEPGYYRVLVSVGSREARGGRTHEQVGDTLVLNDVRETVWILIESKGGRQTDGYDPSIGADTTRYLTHGAYGAFRRRPYARATLPDSQKSASLLSSRSGTFTGRVTYLDNDIPGSSVPTGIPGARIIGWCYDPDYQPYFITYGISDSQGNFSVTCFDDSPGFSGSVVLASSAVSILGRSGAPTGGNVWLEPYTNPTVQVANDNAARVYVNYSTYASNAPVRFGRSRAPVVYWVSEGPAYGTFYNIPNDRIQIGPAAVWNDYGISAAVHEYGHAFQAGAIAPITNYYCSPNGDHYLGAAYTVTCAYVEGFADFFAAALVNPGNTFFGAQIAEQNASRANGNGLLIEAAYAGFLLDMLDGPGDNDLISGDDESIQMVPADLLTVLTTCHPNGAGALDGSDQVVVCLQQSPSARLSAPSAYQNSWRAITYINWTNNVVPTLPAPANVLNNWKYNFYNTVPTP